MRSDRQHMNICTIFKWRLRHLDIHPNHLPNLKVLSACLSACLSGCACLSLRLLRPCHQTHLPNLKGWGCCHCALPSNPSPKPESAFSRLFRAEAAAAVRYLNGTVLDDRAIRVDYDWGFVEGRQWGRGKSGGQVRQDLENIARLS
eukprot:scaffold148028_cov18-Tisochrysis_lutea.AAC.1